MKRGGEGLGLERENENQGRTTNLLQALLFRPSLPGVPLSGISTSSFALSFSPWESARRDLSSARRCNFAASTEGPGAGVPKDWDAKDSSALYLGYDKAALVSKYQGSTKERGRSSHAGNLKGNEDDNDKGTKDETPRHEQLTETPLIYLLSPSAILRTSPCKILTPSSRPSIVLYSSSPPSSARQSQDSRRLRSTLSESTASGRRAVEKRRSVNASVDLEMILGDVRPMNRVRRTRGRIQAALEGNGIPS